MKILKTQEALNYVTKLYGSDAIVEVIDSGYENVIFVVNNTYSVRFPRSLEIWDRSSIERAVLGELGNNSPIKVPRIISINHDPAYVVAEYIKGQQITTNRVRALSANVKAKIGTSVAEFTYYLHKTVGVNKIQSLVPEQKSTYGDYLKRVLVDRTDPNPTIDILAKKYYELWIKMPKDNTVVVHDDLHTGNLIFDNDYNLIGAIDFGAVCIGSPEQDLRQTYRLGNEALVAAANKYSELSGQKIDIDIAKTWTITQELGAYCRQDSGVAHDRAKNNLEFWFSDLLTS
jgi:aminoglycoside phosphotransferase (APT) family kinase protein